MSTRKEEAAITSVSNQFQNRVYLFRDNKNTRVYIYRFSRFSIEKVQAIDLSFEISQCVSTIDGAWHIIAVKYRAAVLSFYHVTMKEN